MREISTNDTIGIREFMEEYLNVDYTEKGHLTHKKMRIFLLDHSKSLPTRVSFDSITKEDIISGRILLVRAEEKVLGNHHSKSKDMKVIAYKNPLRIGNAFTKLNKDKEALKLIREKLLSESIVSDEQRQKASEIHKARYLEKKAKKEELKRMRESLVNVVEISSSNEKIKKYK